MFNVRSNEPRYAFLPIRQDTDVNQYGKEIELVGADSFLAGKSLHINGDPGIGDNPNRYKQHGFHFTADNCIACHACEAACSEKNELPAHISYRSVGYVEGGTYPAFRRLNISMACNHCDEPVCLKGCPTRAYTKFAEYGAVLQDPDICFGCGYCTWVCPYNAPQLDPVKGQVSKCNMCVDRLEVGLKPACASACLAGALDFGVIEATPEHREQAKLSIPGFPTPDITHPNIRFQQVKSLPMEMHRTDSMPLSYIKDTADSPDYQPTVSPKAVQAEWNVKKLRSREDPLVVFTLISQGVIGAFLTLYLGPVFGLDMLSPHAHPNAYTGLLLALLGLETFALALSTSHLGKPRRFYRAFNNLRYSPVSREVAALALFYNGLGLYTVLTAFPLLVSWLPPNLVQGLQAFSGWFAVVMGPLAIYAMQRIYRIPARPFWNHWQVLSAFFGNMMVLGSLLVGLVYAAALLLANLPFISLLSALAIPIGLGLVMEGIGLVAHSRYLKESGREAGASWLEQRTTFGKTYLARNLGLVFSVVMVVYLAVMHVDGSVGFMVWLFTALLIAVTALVGRALFYVLVIPTTMPGAFFWRNRGFEEHARATGLANMPQVGVLPNVH